LEYWKSRFFEEAPALSLSGSRVAKHLRTGRLFLDQRVRARGLIIGRAG